VLVEERWAVDTVVNALRSMPAADRESIMRAVEGRPGHGRPETIRWAVRRFRVRTRLRAMVKGAAAALGVVRTRLKTVEHRLAESVGVSAVVAVVPLAVGLFLLTPQDGQEGGHLRATPTAAHRGATEAAADGEPTDRVAAVITESADSPVSRTNAAPEPLSPYRHPPLAAVEVPGPAGDRPLYEAEVREEEGDHALVCVTNIPALGTYCPVSGDGLALP